MMLSWKHKSLAFRLLEHAPPKLLYLAQKHLSGRSNVSFMAINPVWEFHDRNISEQGAKRLIEFGAGKSLAQNLYFSRRGVEQVLVDLHPMLELDLVNKAIARLVALGVDIDPKPVRSLDELEKLHGIAYRAPYDMRGTDFEDGSFDGCISTSTFEHIPPADLKTILLELKRIIRSGGFISAHIDYSDHYEHTDKSITRLNFLRFDDRQWRRHNHLHHFQNRLRHGHYVKLVQEVDLETVRAEAIDPPAAVPDDVRPELLCGDGNDYFLHGRFLLRV